MTTQSNSPQSGAHERTSHIREHGDACLAIQGCANRLRSMASSARALGMDGLADELTYTARDISEARDEAQAAFNRELNDHFKTTQQATMNMLGAVLAVCDKGKSPSSDTGASR